MTVERLQASKLLPNDISHAGNIIAEPGTYRFRQHGHCGFSEWILVLEGQLAQECAGQHHAYGAGDVIYIDEHIVHELWGHNVRFANCRVNPTLLHAAADLADCRAWLHSAQHMAQPPALRLPPAQALALAEVFQHAIARPGNRAAGLRLLATLFDRFACVPAAEALPDWLRSALAVIDAELERGIVVADLPVICERSPAHIARSFRECLGCSPSTWLNQRRMLRAAELLTTNDLHLTELALDLGYASQSYFNRCFKAVHGMAPGRFRRLQTED